MSYFLNGRESLYDQAMNIAIIRIIVDQINCNTEYIIVVVKIL